MRFFIAGGIATAIAIGALSGGGGSSAGSTFACTGARYYVDYAAGSDANAGTSTGAAWKRAPGMVGFTGTYTHAVHDCFYFKGGTTWQNAAFPMTIVNSGNATAPDYYGPDYTWFTGPAWTRPVFDAGGANIGNGGAAGTKDSFIDVTNDNYITIDNFELTGWRWSAASPVFGNCSQLETFQATHIDYENLYIHGWSHPPTTVDQNCFVVLGDTQPASNCSTCTFNKGVIDGSDSTGGGDSLYGFYGWAGVVSNSVIRYVVSAYLPFNGGTFTSNLIENARDSFDPSSHGNAIETLGTNGTNYIGGNVIHASNFGAEILLVGNPGETDYVWNNVLYDNNIGGTNGNAGIEIIQATSALSVSLWNNTVVTGTTINCVQKGQAGTVTTLKVQNTHCISAAAAVIDPALVVTNPTYTNNVLQTVAAATTDGYTAASAEAYYPTSGSGATVNVGVDLSSNCGTLTTLCSSTGYACTYVVAGHFVTCPNTAPVARPQGGTWDAGAYER